MADKSPSTLATALFGRAREAVIGLLFSDADIELHVREVAKRTGFSAATISAELQRLVAADLVIARSTGNLLLHRANPDHPLYEDLRSIARKTWGIRGRLARLLQPCDDVTCAFVFGSVARGEDRASSDIDVLAIGGADYSELALISHEASEELRRTVNLKLYRPDEWAKKAQSGNPFVKDVMAGPKIYLLGDESLLDELTQPRKPGAESAPRAKAGLARGSRVAPADGHRTARRGTVRGSER